MNLISGRIASADWQRESLPLRGALRRVNATCLRDLGEANTLRCPQTLRHQVSGGARNAMFFMPET